MIAVGCYTDIRFAAVGNGVAGGAITGLIDKPVLAASTVPPAVFIFNPAQKPVG